jgi:hypothetical protein
MKNRKSWVIGGGTLVMAVVYAALSVASPSAGADLLRYYTGFERPAFVLGPLDGQDGWENPSKTAWISPYQPAQGRQAIVVKGAKLPTAGGEGAVIGTRFGRLLFYDATDKVVGIGVDAKLEGPVTENADLVSANLILYLTDPSYTQVIYLGEASLSSAGYILVYESDGDFATAVQVDDMTAYHRLGAQIDFKKGEVKWFADGYSVAELPIDPLIDTSIFATAPIGMAAIDDPGLVNLNNYRARFDNYCAVSGARCANHCAVGFAQAEAHAAADGKLPWAALGPGGNAVAVDVARNSLVAGSVPLLAKYTGHGVLLSAKRLGDIREDVAVDIHRNSPVTGAGLGAGYAPDKALLWEVNTAKGQGLAVDADNILTGNISGTTAFVAGEYPQPQLVIASRALPSAPTLPITLAVTPTEARAAISQTNLRAIVVELSNSKYAGREYGTQGDIDTRNYVKGQLKAAGLVTVNGTWQQFFTLNNRSTANVWAQLPGTDATLKSESIIVSAHHDHLGSNCYGTGTYCPGANDDATGVAAVIELARAVAKVRTLLKKTVVFITFGAEEYGYAGAKYYLAHPPLPLDKTIFMMDFDMLGLNYPNVTTWSPTAKTTRVNLWFNQAFNGVYDDTDSVPWISWEAENWDDLDAVVFRQAGVPNRAWWNRDPYAHTTSDTAYRLNYWVMAETVRMIFDFIMKLATDTTGRAPAPMY